MTLTELAIANARRIPTKPSWRDETDEEARERRERNELIYLRYIKRLFEDSADESA